MGTVAATTRVLDHLVNLILDKNHYVREEAAKVIGQMGAAAAEGDVLDRLVKLSRNKKDDNVRWSVAEAFGQMGAAAAADEVVIRLVELSRDNYVSKRAVYALGQMGATAATSMVFTRLLELILAKNSNNEVRDSAIYALGTMLDKATDKTLNVLCQFWRSKLKKTKYTLYDTGIVSGRSFYGSGDRICDRAYNELKKIAAVKSANRKNRLKITL